MFIKCLMKHKFKNEPVSNVFVYEGESVSEAKSASLKAYPDYYPVRIWISSTKEVSEPATLKVSESALIKDILKTKEKHYRHPIINKSKTEDLLFDESDY